MLNDEVRPTTLKGVKSLAAQLRKERGIKHSVALDLAAQAANCTNFRNARRMLLNGETAFERPHVLLTRYWYDKKQQHRIGRETLKIELSIPILDLCGKSSLKNVRGFGDLRMVADDHFVCDTLDPSQDYARWRLCTAERSLRFMEYTGLRPLHDSRKAQRYHLVADKLPNNDHTTDWIDPTNGQFILIDEPYDNAPDEADRAAWASRTGWRVVKTSWPGMYNPHNCTLYVATDGGLSYDLDTLVAKINAMPLPLLEADWPGISSPSWDTFISPKAKTAQDKRRARCRGTIYPVSSASTVPYSYGLGSSERRPVGKMGIEGHIEAGRIIKAVLRSGQCTFGGFRRLSSLRSALEDWMDLEKERAWPKDFDFFGVYYGNAEEDAPYGDRAKSSADVIAMLGELKRKLQSAYPDCAPLRKQLHRIDMSVSLIGKR